MFWGCYFILWFLFFCRVKVKSDSIKFGFNLLIVSSFISLLSVIKNSNSFFEFSSMASITLNQYFDSRISFKAILTIF